MITLEPMSIAAFGTWRTKAIKDFAQDKIDALTWTPEEALEKSRASYQKLLPQGLHTPGELLWTIDHDGISIGSLWVHVDKTTNHFFIYDINIQADQQNQGYGQQTLQVLEAEARRRHITAIDLHVFGGNLRAQHVYTKMGFITTDINMSKPLE
jgi:ribosomal protein S18 acetylase RimI-like enzyme